jgi:hypothetical protein
MAGSYSPYLDFSPITNALQNAQQMDLARNKLAMEQERLGFERELQPFKLQLAKTQADTGQVDLEKALTKHFGGVAQNIQERAKANPNDPTILADWQKIHNHPLLNQHFKNSPFGYKADDPLGGARMLALEAQGWQDPEQQALIKAHAAQLAAEANKAGYMIGQPGTNIIRIAPPQGGTDTGKVGDVIASQPLRPPHGYEPDPAKPGEYRPIIGGPADIKFTEAKNKALFNVQASSSKADELVQTIDGLLQPGSAAGGKPQASTGLSRNYGVLGALPNSPFGSRASDAWADLQKLKSQGGFLVLQQMREASKTGGALGSVSDAEGARLENAFGALQKTTSVEHAVKELANIRRIALEGKQRMQDAYERQYGTSTPAQTPTRSAPAAAPASGAQAQPRQAPDGKWYVPDPARPGKYLQANP